ncbi:MAG: hypothetical protein OEY36_11480 [Gammaproteobacteria bacterium]|nr:hypothetical protein [Gammaproteobacteria bacterium]
MEENEYRSAYKSLNPHKCIFEKAINSRRCQCDASERFNLADREGVACADALLLKRCQQYLHCMREKARFSLQLTQVNGPLPHAKEIRVQLASILELHRIMHNSEADNGAPLPNIRELIASGIEQYGDLDSFPYPDLIKAISQFKSRQKRQKK